MIRKRFAIGLSATALFFAACDNEPSSKDNIEEVEAEEIDEANERKDYLIENFDPEEYMTGYTHTDLMRNPDDMFGEEYISLEKLSKF